MQRGVTAALEIIDELKRGHWYGNIFRSPNILTSLNELISSDNDELYHSEVTALWQALCGIQSPA
jgi:hypothetical protein